MPPDLDATSLLWPEDDTLSANEKSRVQVVRLLCLLGSGLIPLYGLLYRAALPGATDPMWVRLGIAGLLAAFVGATYVSRTLRARCVGGAWGLLYVLMAWVAALTAANQFSGEYVVGMLVVYTVSATLVLFSSTRLRSVLAFLLAGLLFVGAALLWAPTAQVHPLVLWGDMAMVALLIGIAAQWVLLVRRRLADQAQALQAQRDQLEGHRAYTNRLLNATDDLFFALDEQGHFQWWNDQVLETTGLSEDDIGSVDALDHFVPAEREGEAKQAIRRVFETGSGQVEVPLVTDDGATVPYEFVGNPVESPDGERQIVCVGRNVAERKRRERELTRSERRFQAMLNDPNILAGVLTPDGTLIEQNETGLEYVDAAPDAVVGQPFWKTPWWDDETGPFIREKVRRAASGEYVEYEADLEKPCGTPYTVAGSIRPVTNDDGAVVSMVVSARDITERKKREEALRNAKTEAEEANRLKGAFLANISHEIRTPLTSIIGFAELIGSEASELDLPNSPLPGYATMIERSGKRLLETLEGVLNLSKLQSGQMELETAPVDLARQIRWTVQELRPRAKEKEVGLRLETGPAMAAADEGGVQIVIRNLVSNAIKYTPEGGQVWVRSCREEGRAVLMVEDTGIGMDPGVATSLFEPFRQASEGLNREYEGTGVGLAVTNEAVAQMDGAIEVDTEKDEGTRFTVRLPASAETPSTDGSPV